jgi:formate/nitrite transporter FocA (FNT family)
MAEANVPRHGTAAHLFETVRDAAEVELLRPTTSLWWSGIAAGLAMSTSVVARALLTLHLPATLGSEAISAFGYCFGFIIVVLGRMQLFTENTITTVLPTLRRRDLRTLGLTARLWSLVFVANLVGACLATPSP